MLTKTMLKIARKIMGDKIMGDDEVSSGMEDGIATSSHTLALMHSIRFRRNDGLGGRITIELMNVETLNRADRPINTRFNYGKS